ncbi:hypothetical protein D1631_09470 [Chryseobacterium nematophagum]|uniref:Uncharacterized protein n=1 Tax=Chryseobacterium nematophagum TaxID=2305228 RepID=A0A3M7TEX5_9FLAO|nr:hypothetical protein [Chryseobacterium nematophagum]RNA62143.1 hypothetical protein D1631_09470 [Chryseobacterium nematophagum]
MKILFIIIVLLSGSFYSQISSSVPTDFKKIPDILDTTDYLYPFIVPDKKFEYWSVLTNETDPEKIVIYESQMPEYMTLNDPAPEKGFFQRCLGTNCFSYILACENNHTTYFSSEKQLRDFIGFVDNLPEAILIATTYGFTVDTTHTQSASYKIEDNFISLYVAKIKNCPTSKESFLLKINRKTGKLETKSNGIFFKSDECVL